MPYTAKRRTRSKRSTALSVSRGHAPLPVRRPLDCPLRAPPQRADQLIASELGRTYSDLRARPTWPRPSGKAEALGGPGCVGALPAAMSADRGCGAPHRWEPPPDAPDAAQAHATFPPHLDQRAAPTV